MMRSLVTAAIVLALIAGAMLLTPPSALRTLAAGYHPVLHPSAGA